MQRDTHEGSTVLEGKEPKCRQKRELTGETNQEDEQWTTRTKCEIQVEERLGND